MTRPSEQARSTAHTHTRTHARTHARTQNQPQTASNQKDDETSPSEPNRHDTERAQDDNSLELAADVRKSALNRKFIKPYSASKPFLPSLLGLAAAKGDFKEPQALFGLAGRRYTFASCGFRPQARGKGVCNRF